LILDSPNRIVKNNNNFVYGTYSGIIYNFVINRESAIL